MKALAIVALVFACLSIFIPVGGVFIAMICSILALISFRSQPTLSGITFGIDIINTAFLSPSIVVSDAISSSEEAKQLLDSTSQTTDSGDVYMIYVGFHIILLITALLWRLFRGAPKKKSLSGVAQDD